MQGASPEPSSYEPQIPAGSPANAQPALAFTEKRLEARSQPRISELDEAVSRIETDINGLETEGPIRDEINALVATAIGTRETTMDNEILINHLRLQEALDTLMSYRQTLSARLHDYRQKQGDPTYERDEFEQAQLHQALGVCERDIAVINERIAQLDPHGTSRHIVDSAASVRRHIFETLRSETMYLSDVRSGRAPRIYSSNLSPQSRALIIHDLEQLSSGEAYADSVRFSQVIDQLKSIDEARNTPAE